MRWQRIGVIAVVAAVAGTWGGVTVLAQNQPAAPAAAAAARPQKELLSYGVGFTTGQRFRDGLRDDGVEADTGLLVKGFADGINGNPCALPQDQMDEVMRLVHEEMQNRMVKRMLAQEPAFKKLHDENLRKGREYVEAHRKDEGMKSLPNGVIYQVLKSGSGPSPKLTDTIVVNYRGTLIDGTQFDAADGLELKVSSVIKTGGEVLQQMHVGDKWRVILPPDKGFGPPGRPPMVGPNEVLIADVELLQIK